MAKGYCIGPTICGCNEIDYQDCNNYNAMVAETQKSIEELKLRPPFKNGTLQLPSTNDYAKWVLSKYDLSDNNLDKRADLWRDYDYILNVFYIEGATEDNEKRHDVRAGAATRIYEIPLGFISKDAREFFIAFLNRQDLK